MPEDALDECKQQPWISLDETLDMILPHIDLGQHSMLSTKQDRQKDIWSMNTKGDDKPSRYFGTGIRSK
jgi:hypothetical protein